MAFEIEVKANPFTSAVFYIDETCIRYQNKEIQIRDINGFGYMQTQTSVNGINTSKTFEIHLWHGADDKKDSMRFVGAFGGGAANEKYLTVTDQLWTYFGDRMLNHVHQELLNGKVYDQFIYSIKLTSQGIVTRRKPLFKPAYELLIGWGDVKLSTYQGNITVKSKTNRKASFFASLASKNIWLLYNYINWLANNPQVVSRLIATPNDYKLIEKS